MKRYFDYDENSNCKEICPVFDPIKIGSVLCQLCQHNEGYGRDDTLSIEIYGPQWIVCNKLRHLEG
jgi:hypothetical protein